jgi:hypothetical protein
MSNKDNNNQLNPLEKQIDDINKWQKNATNPGYFVGTGRVPTPLRNILKAPIIMLLLGVIFAVPTTSNLARNFSLETVFSNMMAIVLSASLIIGGTIRLIRKSKT